MSQQYRVKYDDYKEFEKKYDTMQQIGFGSYGSVNILQKKIQNQGENEDLVVKQLKCSHGKKLIQENEVESLQKIQLLPEQYKKRFLKIKNVYYDSINEIINMVIPRAQNSLNSEINIRIQNNKYYAQEDLCFKLSCALEGLFTLETLGMVHRDIKASNLLIMKDGSLVIADLGTAKKLDYQIKQMTIKIGSQQYWPPEYIDNYLKISEQGYQKYFKSTEDNKNFTTNDLYGIGLCFVRAANLSVLPNFKKDDSKFLEIYKSEREKWLEDQFVELNKKYDKQFVSLLEKMVSKDYRNRYSLLQCAETLCKIWDSN